MLILLLAVSHAAVLAFGTFEGPKVVAFVGGLVAKFQASRAVKNAEALVAAAEANAKALEAAKKLVASTPVAAATGPSGTTGATGA